jgi:hypothetical protein
MRRLLQLHESIVHTKDGVRLPVSFHQLLDGFRLNLAYLRIHEDTFLTSRIRSLSTDWPWVRGSTGEMMQHLATFCRYNSEVCVDWGSWVRCWEITRSSRGCTTGNFWKKIKHNLLSGAGIAQWYSAGLRAGWSGVRVQVGGGNFSPHLRVHTGSGNHPASYPMGTGDSSPGGKAAGTWSWPLTSI